MVAVTLVPYYSWHLLKKCQKKLHRYRYTLATKIEINLSDHYRQYIIGLLSEFSIFSNNNKSFKHLTRQGILAFLDNYQKSETRGLVAYEWIGAYNTYRIHLNNSSIVYYPKLESNKRPKPQVI